MGETLRRPQRPQRHGRSVTRVDVRLQPDERRSALRAEALAGLSRSPKELKPKWFYDERGSALFDEITRLPEYYLTRCEREILEARAGEIAELTRAETLVELGSGTSEKTRLLLDALAAAGALRCYVPFDVSEATLRESADAVAREYPGLDVVAIVGDVERHLTAFPSMGRRLVAFLGSSIGNFDPAARARFFGALRAALEPGDGLLLGADLVKDAARLEAAYDDAQGVTAAFNRNVLSVLNRELDADFDPDAFEHVARYDEQREWVEMLLRSRRDQAVRVGGVTVGLGRGEELRTEISAKFRRDGVERELRAAGFEPREWWTDSAGEFGLSLAEAVARADAG